MPLGTNHMDITTGATFIRTVWSKEVMLATEENLVFADRISRFDTDAKLGRTIVVPNVSNLTAYDKTAGVAVSLNAITETSVNITINKHKVVPFLEEDALKNQEAYNLAQIYGAKAGYAISEAIDSDIAALIAGASQFVGTYNTDALTDIDMLRAIQYLDDANAPQKNRAFVFKPAIKSYLFRTENKFFDASIRGDAKNPVITGNFGDFYGVPAYISTNLYSSGDNDSNVLIQKEALALALNMKTGVEKQRILEHVGDLYLVQALYGVQTMRSTFLVEIKS